MKDKLFMETTKIDVSKTVAEIQSILGTYESCVSQTSRLTIEMNEEELAKELFEMNQRELYGPESLTWDMAIRTDMSGMVTYQWRVRAKSLKSSMDKWVKVVVEK